MNRSPARMDPSFNLSSRSNSLIGVVEQRLSEEMLISCLFSGERRRLRY